MCLRCSCSVCGILVLFFLLLNCIVLMNWFCNWLCWVRYWVRLRLVSGCWLGFVKVCGVWLSVIGGISC